MKHPFLLLALFAALLSPRASAVPTPMLSEPGPFHFLQPSSPEPLILERFTFFSAITVWASGGGITVESWPVELEPSAVSLARAYTFSVEKFSPQIHFLYTPPWTPAKSEPPTAQRGSEKFRSENGKFNFNIGYQF